MKKINFYYRPLAIALIFVLAGLVIFPFVRQEVIKGFELEIVWTSGISAAALNTSYIKEINVIFPSDFSEEEGFKTTNSQILAMGSLFASKGIDAIYVLAQKEGKVYFVSESTPYGEPLYIEPGTVYEQAPLEALSAFNNEYSPIARYSDEFGTYISKFTPIIDPETNEPVGVLGVDVDNSYYQQQLVRAKIIFGLIWFAIYLIFIILFMYFRSLYKIKNESKLNEQKIKAISNAIDDGLVVVNSGSLIAYWNKSAENIFGVTASSALGANFNEIVKNIKVINVSSNQVVSDFEFSLNHYPTNAILEVNFTDINKIKKYYELFINAIEINKEKFLVGVFHDISNRKAEEKKLELQNEELEKLNNLMMGRELKMIELKKIISELKFKA